MDVYNYIFQVFLVFVISTSIFLYFFVRRRYNYWKDRGIVYEKPVPFIGNLSFLLRKSCTEFFKELWNKHRSRDYVGVFLGWQPMLVVQTPELAKKILVKDSEYFQDRYLYSSFSTDPLGSLNLFTVKNPIWSNMRHELSSMFTSKRLKIITELMNINSEQLVRRIQRESIDNKKAINLKELFSMYTSDTVAYSVFGFRVSVLNDEPSPLWFITSHMVKWTFWRGFEFTMIFFIPALAKLLRLKFFSVPATEYVKKIFLNVVEERKKAGHSANKDLVNHMLQLRDNMKLPAENSSQLSEDLMMAQVAVFILGAIETSSSTLSYCVHELAHHPNEQEMLYEEINDALKRSGKDILEYDDLLDLKYLTACINETMRKYPLLPYVERMCNGTYKLTDEVTIEKGVPVAVNVMSLHYDERYFPEPEQWRPRRLKTASDNDNLQSTFLPFGDGPRFCIGKRYGLMQIRTALAQMTLKFKFEPVPEEPYIVKFDPYSVISSPKTGGRVKFVER